MTVFQIDEVQGTRFPAGRHTRVIVGPGGPVEAQGFVMGHVTIFPGGSVPVHSHAQEEVYFMFCYAPKGIVDHWQPGYTSISKPS